MVVVLWGAFGAGEVVELVCGSTLGGQVTPCLRELAGGEADLSGRAVTLLSMFVRCFGVSAQCNTCDSGLRPYVVCVVRRRGVGDITGLFSNGLGGLLHCLLKSRCTRLFRACLGLGTRYPCARKCSHQSRQSTGPLLRVNRIVSTLARFLGLHTAKFASRTVLGKKGAPRRVRTCGSSVGYRG